jgi:hypothetical protein
MHLLLRRDRSPGTKGRVSSAFLRHRVLSLLAHLTPLLPDARMSGSVVIRVAN